MYVINGILFGLVLMVLIGPVFFTLIQTSIEKGFKKAILVAFGILCSDSLFIILSYIGISQLINEKGYDEWLGYAGGVILCAFGFFYLWKSRQSIITEAHSVSAKGTFRFIIKGFLINGISPNVLLFWIGAMSLASMRYGYHGKELFIFFTATLLTVFLSDMLKAYLAGKLRSFIKPKTFKILNLLVGITMIGFGIHMLFYTYSHLKP